MAFDIGGRSRDALVYDPTAVQLDLSGSMSSNRLTLLGWHDGKTPSILAPASRSASAQRLRAAQEPEERFDIADRSLL